MQWALRAALAGTAPPLSVKYYNGSPCQPEWHSPFLLSVLRSIYEIFPFCASGNVWPERNFDSIFSLEIYNVCFKGAHKFNNREAGRGRSARGTQAELREATGQRLLRVRCAKGLTGSQFILIPVDR